MASRRQFGLKHLLLLTFLVAIGIVVWLQFIYVHPAHKFGLYEKAPYSRTGRITIDSSTISVQSVSRNDRNKTLLVEDGFGKASNATAPHGQLLKDCGAWLDAAQIEMAITPGDFEVLEARVFDHETRQLITGKGGNRMVDPRCLQIYRMGARLPDQVDVFLRLHVYDPKDKAVKLPPQAEASCNLLGGQLIVSQLVVGGIRSYSAATGAVPNPAFRHAATAIMLRFEGTWPDDARYQIVAVKQDGSRAHTDFFLRFPGSYLDEQGRRAVLVELPAGLDDIQHFEVRPAGGWHRFFFEGLRLPVGSKATFQQPPNPVVKVDGAEVTRQVPSLLPLSVSIQTMRGDAASGSSSGGSGMNVLLRDEAKNLDSQATIIARVEGVFDPGWDLKVLPSNARFTQNGSHSSGNEHLSHRTAETPIEQIAAVQILMPPP